MKKTLLTTLAVLGIIIVGIISYRIHAFNKIKNVKSEDVIISVGTETLKKENITKKLYLQSIVDGDPQVKIYPGVSGKFSYNAVKEGDFVQKDQTITYIDRDVIGASYNLAAIKSPISGMVIKLYYYDKGNSVSTQQVVAEVADTTKIKMVVNLGEEDLLTIKEGATVKITSSYTPDIAVNGRVDSVTPFIDRDTMSGTVIIKADNSTKTLKVGMSVDLAVETGNISAFTLPERAIIMGQKKLVIYKNDNGIAKEIIVKTGYSYGDRVVVTGDLKAGDEIIVEGNFKVYDGAKINVIK